MKKFYRAIIVIIAMVFVANCSSQVKETPDVGGENPFVGASNTQLSKYPVAGFAYKSSQVPPQEWDRWAKVAAPAVKEIVNNMPDGYLLELRGHTDARGPEEAENAKPGNIKISTDRAKAVHDSLAKSGITSDKITYRGVGSSEPLNGVDPSDPRQRRVTFLVVPKK